MIYILRNFINTKDNFFVISIGIGMMFVSILVSIFLFFQILTKNNILLLFLLLQFPLVSIIIKNQLSHYRPIFFKKNSMSVYYLSTLFIFSIIILSSTEYLTPGDKYRWELMKQYINHGGYFNPSFDFRNMAQVTLKSLF